MDNSIIDTLPAISIQLNRSILIIQIILGTFGNIMNILIFTRRTLRTNPCSLYFLASSINNIFVLYVPVLTRLLSSGWSIDPTNTNNALCKLRIYVVYTSLTLIQWYVALASIDRYLSSSQSASRRQMSSVSIAKKAIGITTIFIAIAHFHTLVWWSVDYIGPKTYCNIFVFPYEIAFQVFFLAVTCIIPLVIMAIFGALTILHIKNLRSKVAPQNNDGRNDRLRSKDLQLVVTILIQVFVTLFCSLPFSVGNIALIFTQYVTPLSDVDDAIFTFYLNLSRILLYFNPVLGFYIYTLAGRAFRAEMKVMCTGAMKFILPKLGLEKFIPRKNEQIDGTLTNNGRTLMSRPKIQQQEGTIVQGVDM